MCHIHTYTQITVTSEPNMHVSGWWEEARVPGQKPAQTWGEYANSTYKGTQLTSVFELGSFVL